MCNCLLGDGKHFSLANLDERKLPYSHVIRGRHAHRRRDARFVVVKAFQCLTDGIRSWVGSRQIDSMEQNFGGRIGVELVGIWLVFWKAPLQRGAEFL